MSPILSAVFILRNDLNSDQNISRYGSLFSEFKNNRGKFGSMFYPIYFSRRIVFAVSQVMLNEYPIIQVSLNLAFALLQFSHLVYYRPFKDIGVFISELAGELCTLFVSGVVCLLLRNNSDEDLLMIEDLIIYSILACGFVQYMVCLYSVFKSISELVKMIMKNRAQQFIKNANKMSIEIGSGTKIDT